VSSYVTRLIALKTPNILGSGFVKEKEITINERAATIFIGVFFMCG
jgi:hypothetical protein